MPAPRVLEVPVPPTSLAARAFPGVDYADAFSVTLHSSELRWVDTVARELFLSTPGWIRALFAVRERLAGLVGLKTTQRRPTPAEIEDFVFRRGSALGLFQVCDRTAAEILLGEDDRHLDFRLSVLLESEGMCHRVTVSTVVRLHGWLGRLYFLPVRLFHRVIVPVMIRRAVASLGAEHALGGVRVQRA
jgi:hypothetical protein